MTTNGNNRVTLGAIPKFMVVTLPELILSAIKNGDVSHVVSSVKVAAKTSPTKKEESRSYDELRAQNAAGMAAICGGKLEINTPPPAEGEDERTKDEKRLGAANHFNYGYDLARRAKTRAKLMTDLEGPDKAIAKAVKALVDADMFDTEDEAREHVLAKRKARADAAAAEAESEQDSGSDDAGDDDSE